MSRPKPDAVCVLTWSGVLLSCMWLAIAAVGVAHAVIRFVR